MLLDKKGRSYYQCDFTEEDHRRLRDMLKGIKGKFILAYDDHPFVKKLYKGFRMKRVDKVLFNEPMAWNEAQIPAGSVNN
jgi:site-specific DNA-adenine methylase